MNREWARLRELLKRSWARLRWVPEAIALFVGLVIVLFILSKTWRGADWAATFRGQALNIAFGFVLASFGYLLYFLRFRQAQLNKYLERSRLARSRSQRDLEPLAQTIVDELLDARPPHACLIKGPAGTEHPRLLTDVAGLLASKHWPANRVPVVVDVSGDAGDASLPSLTRERFVTRLVGSSGDEASAKRLFASMVKKRKVVALIEGLDRLGLGTPLSSRRATLARLLEGSLSEGIPFVAWVSEDLAPSISEVAAFRAGPMPDRDFVSYIRQGLRPGLVEPDDKPTDMEVRFRDKSEKAEPTRDLALLRLALDLFDRRVHSGEDGARVLDSLFVDPCAVRRRFSWMCSWALDVALGDIDGLDSASKVALAAIGREAHFLRESEVSWTDASRSFDDAGDRRRFAAGVASLTQRNVLTASGSGSGAVLRFTHPMWFAFAGILGLKVEKSLWCDLLQPGIPVATLDALTGALLTYRPPTASFVQALAAVGATEPRDISLEMIRAAILALQADEDRLTLEDQEIQMLQGSWSAANDVSKLRFVSAVDLRRDPRLIDFLWSQVVHPQFDKNAFRVRRAICTRLGQLGDPAWTTLNETWRDHMASVDERALRVSARHTDEWRKAEYPLASLGWVLPGLLLTVGDQREDAYALLAELRAFQVPAKVQIHDLTSPDIGMEISLAEGFKAAAVETFSKGRTDRLIIRSDGEADDRWWLEGCGLLESSDSWISQQALIQALALARSIAPEDVPATSVGDVVGSWSRSKPRHPFALETARLVLRSLEEAPSKESKQKTSRERVTQSMPEKEIWFEGVESLEDGGVTLSPAAHQLLGLSTLLINLAERHVEVITDRQRKQAKAPPGNDVLTSRDRQQALVVREQILSTVRLPGCFRKTGQAATMHRFNCQSSCNFDAQLDGTEIHQADLCGKDAMDDVLKGRRNFSRSFLQRAEVTARSVPSEPRWLPRAVRRAKNAFTRSDRERRASARVYAPIWKLLDTKVQAREEGR